MIVCLFLTGCQPNHLENGTWSLRSDELFLEMIVEPRMWSQKVCVNLVSTVVMTDGCVDVTVETMADEAWLSVPVHAGVGELTFQVRIQNGVVKVPHRGLDGFVEGILKPSRIPADDFTSFRQQTDLSIQAKRKAWEQGAFSLQNAEGDIKGALVFESSSVRILVFDRHWLTPNVQYASMITEGMDWIVSFDTEPQFFDEQTYIRIHLLDEEVTVPQGPVRQANDITYRLVSDPPDFTTLEQFKQQEIARSHHEEQVLLQDAIAQLQSRVATAESCMQWKASGPFWLGYEVITQWENGVCTFTITPEVLQYRRTFEGTLFTNGPMK